SGRIPAPQGSPRQRPGLVAPLRNAAVLPYQSRGYRQGAGRFVVFLGRRVAKVKAGGRTDREWGEAAMTEGLNIEREIFIAAPPEIAFKFLVEPAYMALWFGHQHTLDPRPGGIFRVEVSAGNVAQGTYLEVTPHRRVAFTWGWEGRDDLPPGRSLVEFDL